MAEAMPSLFDAETAILAKIREAVPELITVETGDFLSGAKDITKLCPAAFLLAGGGDDHATTSKGAMICELQEWQIIVCVAYLKKSIGSSTAIIAGQYLLKIIDALSGFEPTDKTQPLRYVSPRPEPYYGNGFAEFPINFETRYTI